MRNQTFFEKTPKILFVITRHAEFGGAQIHVRDLARLINQSGGVAEIATGAIGPVSESAQALGIRVHHIPELVREISPAKDLRAAMALRNLIKTTQPDLVSLHSSKAGIIGRIAAFGLKKAVVFTAHGWAFTDGVPPRTASLYRIIERAFSGTADKIICVSENDRQIALKANVAGPGKLVTIHNGMPDISLPKRIKREEGEPLRFIQVSRFAPQKNQALLIEAFASLERDDWRLTLVGSGDDTACKTLADDLGVADRVEFLGQRADIPELLAQSDIFCLSTNWEGFPRATIEAMRAGMPAIVTRAGGSAEAVLENETGFSVPRGDMESLAGRLAYFLEAPEKVAQFGAAARQRFEDRFTFNHMAEQTFSLHETLLAKKN